MEGGVNRAPVAAEVAQLWPSLPAALGHTGLTLGVFALGVTLSRTGALPAYLGGQALLAFGFVHAFVLLHEAGHDTLFRSRRANRLVGHLAGFLTLIPFWSWQRIHARHHHYTGWQDLDATTASLVPRPLGPWERRFIDFAWAAWLPVFALTYRIQNFWNLPRVGRYIRNPHSLRRIRWNTLALLLAYTLLLAWAGPAELLKLIGPALLLSLVLQEPLILSQHTHVPQRVAGGRHVVPFPPAEQAAFTRSLRLPAWLSLLLLHFDAHELHHMYPQVPGYRLRGIAYRPPHEVGWWRWLKAARGLSGTAFLFRNWDETGVRL